MCQKRSWAQYLPFALSFKIRRHGVMVHMALHSKKLHVRKAGVVSDINLYTTLSEAGNSALAIRDGGTTAYAKLGAATDALASPLRVRKNGETYAVLTSAAKAGIAPLFAFTTDRYNDYSYTSVMALYGDRTLSSTTYSFTTKYESYGQAHTVTSFLDGTGTSRILLSRRNPGGSYIIDPFASTWSSYVDQLYVGGNGVYDADTLTRYLYTTSFNGIEVYDMLSSYIRTLIPYVLPAPDMDITVPNGYRACGDKIMCVTAGTPEGSTQPLRFVYVLCSIADDAYWNRRRTNSYIVKYHANNLSGALIDMDYIEVEKSARTWQHFGNKLYICCDGNRYATGNSCLQIVDLSDSLYDITDHPVVTVPKPTSMANGYFHDITIADNSHVYIILGNQAGSNSYTSVYHTNTDNITEPALWSKVFETTVNESAVRFWGIYNESGKLYVVGSNRIHIFDSLPTGFVNPTKTLSTGVIDTFTQII